MMDNAGSAVRRLALAWDEPPAWPVLRQLAELTLRACAAKLAQVDPEWLGHLKLLLETGQGAAYCSITGAGEPLSWRGTVPTPVSPVTVTLYGVVWGMADASVAEAVDGAFVRIDGTMSMILAADLTPGAAAPPTLRRGEGDEG